MPSRRSWRHSTSMRSHATSMGQGTSAPGGRRTRNASWAACGVLMLDCGRGLSAVRNCSWELTHDDHGEAQPSAMLHPWIARPARYRARIQVRTVSVDRPVLADLCAPASQYARSARAVPLHMFRRVGRPRSRPGAGAQPRPGSGRADPDHASGRGNQTSATEHARTAVKDQGARN